MEDLLERGCLITAPKEALSDLCRRYRIPTEGIETGSPEPRTFIVSVAGVREYGEDRQDKLPVFDSLDALRLHLFERALFRRRLVVNKGTYEVYLKTLDLLNQLGIKTILDKTYFDDAYGFYVIANRFEKLNLFGCKCIVSMTNGVQFGNKEFLDTLREYAKAKANIPND